MRGDRADNVYGMATVLALCELHTASSHFMLRFFVEAWSRKTCSTTRCSSLVANILFYRLCISSVHSENSVFFTSTSIVNRYAVVLVRPELFQNRTETRVVCRTFHCHTCICIWATSISVPWYCNIHFYICGIILYVSTLT